MTRAKRELILSFHETASSWINAVSSSIALDYWSSCEIMNDALRHADAIHRVASKLFASSFERKDVCGSCFAAPPWTMHGLALKKLAVGSRDPLIRALCANVAKRIIEMAQRGVTDQEKLAADAVRFISANYVENYSARIESREELAV